MYFASTAGVDTLSIQYAVGVSAMPFSWGLGGSTPFAAALAFDVGLT
jgi:hypothetical protein